MRPFFPTAVLLLLTMLVAVTAQDKTLGLLLPGQERSLQETECVPSSSSSATGDFRNLIAKITLPRPGINEVQIELIYDVNIRTGSLTRLSLPIFLSEFGRVRGVSADVNVDGSGPTFSELTVRNSGGGTIEADICFGRRISTDFSVQLSFTVSNMICDLNGEQVIISSWVSQLTTVFTRFVEIDYSVLLGDNGFGDSFTPRFAPGSSRAVSVREQIGEEEFLTVYIPYDRSTLNLGDSEGAESFLKIGNRFYKDLPSCPTTSETNLLIYVIAAIPALSCCCLCVLGISQFIMDRQDMHRRRNFRWFTRFNLFQTNNDIVLAPDGEGLERQTTVRAVPESQLTGATTAIDVNISHYIQDGDDALRGSL